MNETSRGHDGAAESIPRIPAPSLSVFEREYVRRSQPVVITGVVERWPAFKRWSAAYLRQKLGQIEVPVGRLNDGKVWTDEVRHITYDTMTFDRGVSLVYSNNGQHPAHYLAAQLRGQLKRLLDDDVVRPQYCRRTPLSRSRLFVAASGMVSPMHRDFPENLFAQVAGRKRFVFIPRSESACVYPYPLFSDLPQASPVDAEFPDYDRFPELRRAHPITVEVEPGDLLFVPSRWWHQVRTLESSLSINWWWPSGLWNMMLDAAENLQKKVRGVRW